MDHMDNFCERFEALERRTQMVERRLRWWRGIACGVIVLALLSLALPSGKAADTQPRGMAERMATVERKLAAMDFDDAANEVVISGANLRIVNGLGATDTTNGLGNLIVGYNELRGDGFVDTRTGSYNAVVGRRHNFPSFGGLTVGDFNEIGGEFASVSGGSGNTASGRSASVSGGAANIASRVFASISGGGQSTASGSTASVSGGGGGRASGVFSSVCGGAINTATADSSTVCGGSTNTASGPSSSICGGQNNLANSIAASVSGGEHNTARRRQERTTGRLAPCSPTSRHAALPEGQRLPSLQLTDEGVGQVDTWPHVCEGS